MFSDGISVFVKGGVRRQHGGCDGRGRRPAAAAGAARATEHPHLSPPGRRPTVCAPSCCCGGWRRAPACPRPGSCPRPPRCGPARRAAACSSAAPLLCRAASLPRCCLRPRRVAAPLACPLPPLPRTVAPDCVTSFPSLRSPRRHAALRPPRRPWPLFTDRAHPAPRRSPRLAGPAHPLAPAPRASGTPPRPPAPSLRG